jgi:hypothetical protein
VTDLAPKPCAHCGKPKDASAYQVIPAHYPGQTRLHSWCKTCVRINKWLRREAGLDLATERAYYAREDARQKRRERERRRYWRKKMAG